jgi:hypothetical protein
MNAGSTRYIGGRTRCEMDVASTDVGGVNGQRGIPLGHVDAEREDHFPGRTFEVEGPSFRASIGMRRWFAPTVSAKRAKVSD